MEFAFKIPDWFLCGLALIRKENPSEREDTEKNKEVLSMAMSSQALAKSE